MVQTSACAVKDTHETLSLKIAVMLMNVTNLTSHHVASMPFARISQAATNVLVPLVSTVILSISAKNVTVLNVNVSPLINWSEETASWLIA